MLLPFFSVGPVESTSNPSNTDTLPVVMIIMFPIPFLVATIFLAYWLLKKHFARQVDVPRRSMDEITEQQESLVADHTGIILENSQSNNESPDLNHEVCQAESSVAIAGREDSSVKVRSETT